MAKSKGKITKLPKVVPMPEKVRKATGEKPIKLPPKRAVPQTPPGNKVNAEDMEAPRPKIKKAQKLIPASSIKALNEELRKLRIQCRKQESDLTFSDHTIAVWEKIGDLSIGMIAKKPREVGSEEDRIFWRVCRAKRCLDNGEPERAKLYLNGDNDDDWSREALETQKAINEGLARKLAKAEAKAQPKPEKPAPVPAEPVVQKGLTVKVVSVNDQPVTNDAEAAAALQAAQAPVTPPTATDPALAAPTPAPPEDAVTDDAPPA